MNNNLPGFKEDQKQLLVRKLMQLEKERRASKPQILFTWIFSLALVVFIWYLAIGSNAIDKDSFGVPVLFSIVIILIAFGINSSINNRLRREFKDKAIKNLIKYLLPNITYNPKGRISVKRMKRSNLFKQYINHGKGEDLFTGKRGETEFKLSEVLAQNKSTCIDSDGDTQTSYEDIFDGIFIHTNLNLTLNRAVKIFHNHANERSIPKSIKRYKTNIKDFDRKFTLYAYHEEDAKKIIDSSFIQDIVLVHEIFNRPVLVSFMEGSIHVGIETYEQFFDPSLNNKIGLEQVERIYAEIVNCLMVVDMIDEFNQGGKRTFHQDQIAE